MTMLAKEGRTWEASKKASKQPVGRRSRRRLTWDNFMGLIGMASLLVAPLHKAFAPETWNAGLDASPAAGMASKQILITWGR
jgi:hypothetical protein